MRRYDGEDEMNIDQIDATKNAILKYLDISESSIDIILLGNIVDDCITYHRTAKEVVDYYWELEDMRWCEYVSDHVGYEWIDGARDGALLRHYYTDEDY